MVQTPFWVTLVALTQSCIPCGVTICDMPAAFRPLQTKFV